MLPKKSPEWVNDSKSMVRFLRKLVSAATISSSAARVSCALILICAGAALGLGGQNASDDKGPQAPPNEPAQCTAVKARPPSPSKTHNIEDDTKAALANQWIAPEATGHVLKALEWLTSSSRDPKVDREVLDELKIGDTSQEGLYLAAMGNPDDYGQPRVQGLPNFVDTLAKANRLNLQQSNDEDQLFTCTAALIENIFNKKSKTPTPPAENTNRHQQKTPQKPEEDPGPVALARVHDSFSRKDNYLALLQLMNAYQKDAANYSGDLEKLRAAFEMNADRLALQVAAKITPSGK